MTTKDALETLYSLALGRDKAKPFDDEFARTTNLERAILDEHGRLGAEFLLQRIGFESTGDGTPWSVTSFEDARVVVRDVFSSLRADLPYFVDVLEDRVLWVFAGRIAATPTLAYVTDRVLYDGRRYFEVLFGGAPTTTPRLSDRAESLGWVVPRSLRSLCAVHDGLRSTDRGLSQCRELVDLGEIMDPIAAEQQYVPTGYRFQDLLEFFPDGSGNGQSFHRRHRDDDDPPTVDWDHETREISDESSFFEFTDQALAGQITDEE
jgi:hypothetical protein